MSDDLIARLRSPEEIVFPAGTKIVLDGGKTMELLEPFSMWSSSSDKHDAAAEIVLLRAEIERLQAERDALRDTAREYLETLGGAMKSGKFEMGGSAEMAHFVRQAMQRLDSLVFDRTGPRPAGLEKLHEPHGRAS
jgi:hypothetical protein